MISNVIRIITTLKYLKLKQINYQLFYRLKKYFIDINKYNKYNNDQLYTYNVDQCFEVFPNKELLRENFNFNFLGKSHSFENKINWNFNENGKLWNYNLQYLNYINDDSVDLKTRLTIINDISKKLIDGDLKLEPYPVSIRIVSLFLFHQNHPIKCELVLRALLLQINYLENNLEYHLLANHLLENIFALFIAGHFMNNSSLIKKSTRLLLRELNEQTLDDGAHYESTPMYHIAILSKLLLCVDISRQAGFLEQIDLKYLENQASLMFSWLYSYSFPDGSYALFNDSALGIYCGTNELKNYIKFLKLPYKKVKLNQSGFTKLVSNKTEIIIKTGNISPSYQPGHIHSDMLSYCVWHNGCKVIIDPGVSTYEDNSSRRHDKSTINHNTISINHENQSDLWSSFRVGHRSKCKILKHDENTLQLSLTNLSKHKNIQHIRSFKLIENQLTIDDKIINCVITDILCNNIHFDHKLKLDLNVNKLISNDFNIEFISGFNGIKINNFNQYIYFGEKISSKKLESINDNHSVMCISFN